MEVKTFLRGNKIACVKYNYALDQIVAKNTSFAAFMVISKDLKFIKIFIHKAAEENKYILESDKELLLKARINEH